MTDDFATRCDRVRRVLRAAARIADHNDPLGQEARSLLPTQTGLSPEGVELGLQRHLETAAPDALIGALVSSSPCAPRVHVVLSANVFVGAVRAIALGLAASPQVFVRPSRRDPVMAELLVRALLDESLSPPPTLVRAVASIEGDMVHAYGRQDSVDAIARGLARGVRFWAHGPGLGIVILGDGDEKSDAAEQLSWDVIAFDQRGCLSPRLVLWAGQLDRAYEFAARLNGELARRQLEVPRGRLDPTEAADAAMYIRTMQMVGSCWHTDRFAIGVDPHPIAATVPPVGRHVHVACIGVEGGPAPTWLVELCPFVTTVGVSSARATESPSVRALRSQLAQLTPGARVAELGQMQRPPFDGPVDRRFACAST